MSIKIREVTISDSKQIHNIRHMSGVMDNILSYPTEPYEKIKSRIKNISQNDYWFVSEMDGLVVGLVILNRHGNPRKSHVGHISIMVNSDFHGQGIGSSLMKYIIDFADCKLGLKRLELFVFEENETAIRLYEKFGFEIEGRMRGSAMRNNEYSDELVMGRVKV